MTNIIDFEEYKKSKEKENATKNIWHSFPCFIDDKFDQGDILVAEETFDDNGIHYKFSMPVKQEIIEYNVNECCADSCLIWASMKDVSKIIFTNDDLIG